MVKTAMVACGESGRADPLADARRRPTSCASTLHGRKRASALRALHGPQDDISFCNAA